MFQRKKLRALLEARINEAAQHYGDHHQGQLHGRQRFVEEIHALLGVYEQAGEGQNASFFESVDDLGRPTLAKGRARPEEFSLRVLAEAIGGHEWVETTFNPMGGADRRTLLEAGPGIDPTAFLNINTFSLAVAGLVNAKILERFANPAFIGDQLCTTVPTRQNGEKMIGVTGIGDKARERKPNEPHPRAGFGEHYITTPELKEQALATEVTQEAVFYDLTNQVLDTAGSVGDELGYLKEKTQIDLAIGVDNPYVYNGVAYNTYQTSTPWVNSHTNELQDHTDIQNAIDLFTQMTDPATGKEILVMPTTILHMPQREADFNRVLNSTEIRETTNTNTVTISPPNNHLKGYTRLSSPILYNRAASANGLNLGATNAKKRWWIGDFKKAFMWMEAWPLRVRQASANEYVMLDRGLVAAYFANYRGIGAVREPRQVCENTH